MAFQRLSLEKLLHRSACPWSSRAKHDEMIPFVCSKENITLEEWDRVDEDIGVSPRNIIFHNLQLTKQELSHVPPSVALVNTPSIIFFGEGGCKRVSSQCGSNMKQLENYPKPMKHEERTRPLRLSFLISKWWHSAMARRPMSLEARATLASGQKRK